MKLLSLRSSLLLGALLWTLGLFALAGIGMTKHPQLPRAFHTTFRHEPPVILFAIVCMAIGLLQVRRGVSPINRLRTRLVDVREGRELRLEGSYPAEVQPLVDDLNALLDERERRVGRAMAKAADLAHGLKTPLAVLANEARHIGNAGASDAAAAIDQQVQRMQRQIDFHLAHARASASGADPSARTPVRETVQGLVRALTRLHANIGHVLTIDDLTEPAHVFKGQREDLEEMLGNLLDNACRWARMRVTIRSSVADGVLAIDVDDDGPGIPESMRDAVLQRGVKADEAAPGSGLGLAIVRDLADLYGGGIALSAAPSGGLRARLTLPAATPFLSPES